MKKLITIYTILVLMSITVKAQDRKIAVLDPVRVGEVKDYISEIVREEISMVVVNAYGYTVLERSLINKVLEENKMQASGLVDDSQISEMGKRMGASLVLVTTITKMENGSYHISCKMTDVLTARIEKQKTGTTRKNSDDLIDVVNSIVKEMFVSSGVAENSSKYDEKPKQDGKQEPATNTGAYQQPNSYSTIFTDLGLMVLNKSFDSQSWTEAINFCQELDRGGYKDWYLPSKNELISIFEAGNKSFNRELESSWYWSSTEIDDKKAYNVAQSGWAPDEKKKAKSPDCICVRKLK